MVKTLSKDLKKSDFSNSELEPKAKQFWELTEAQDMEATFGYKEKAESANAKSKNFADFEEE